MYKNIRQTEMSMIVIFPQYTVERSTFPDIDREVAKA